MRGSADRDWRDVEFQDLSSAYEHRLWSVRGLRPGTPGAVAFYVYDMHLPATNICLYMSSRMKAEACKYSHHMVGA